MKVHSMIDMITNSSSMTYIYPQDNTDEKIKDLFKVISAKIKEKYEIDIDLSLLIKTKIIPSESWIEEQYMLREDGEAFDDMTDAEFEKYINNIDNAYEEQVLTGNDRTIPRTELVVEMDGDNISSYFDLFYADSIVF